MSRLRYDPFTAFRRFVGLRSAARRSLEPRYGRPRPVAECVAAAPDLRLVQCGCGAERGADRSGGC